MGGSPLLIREQFVAVFPSLVRALGSMEAAAILQHLHFIADDEWATVTKDAISEATGIHSKTVERRLDWLREQGLIESRRAEKFNATLQYRVRYDHPLLAVVPET